MGSARTITGTIRNKGFSPFIAHKAPTEANMNPANVLPESPRNIFAGRNYILGKQAYLIAKLW